MNEEMGERLKRDRILFRGFTLKKVVTNRIASFLILQILKHIQLLRFSHICCSAMDATQSIHPAWGPIMFSTSPVSHLQHKISRAFDTNKYRRPTRLIRTLSNTFKRHSNSSVSFHFFILYRSCNHPVFHASKKKISRQEKFLSP